MTDAAITSASTYAQVRVREPAGDRTFGETPTLGGEGANVVVPGIGAGVAIQIERRRGVWVAHPIGETRVRFDGRPLMAPRDLRRHDVIAVGDAQVVVIDVSRTLLKLEVCHLVGNVTISPASAISAMAHGDGDEDLLIQAPRIVARGPGPEDATAAEVAVEPVPAIARWQLLATRGFRVTAAAVAVAVLLLMGILSQLHPVTLDLEPRDARVRVPGTLVAIHGSARLLLLSGEHIIRAEHAGYEPAQVRVTVNRNSTPTARLWLTKLPGTLHIDTAGVAATIDIDGIDSGRSPSVLTMSAGAHTISVRAPRYVDYIVTVNIEGAGVRQDLKAVLQPSWGTLQISAIPAGAHVSVDGADNGVAPVVVDAPSGVRQVRISAPNLKTWESSVVLKAGEALNVGPVTLGQPDAHLSLTSVPGAAEVTIGGVFRGQTPLEVNLPAGIEHELIVSYPGYAPWTRQVFANAGKKISLDARLESAGARVTIQGEPDGAELLIDGVDRGRTPQTLDLSATEHRIQVSKDGWVPYMGTVTPARGFDRTVQYRLVPRDRALASTLYTQTGYQLRLVPAGTFTSERREQDRRPNAGSRQVTLQRPFYLGVSEVSNEQFRRFRPDHSSGSGGHRSLDPDEQPATRVNWNEAAEYCNWLSERDNLPVAYEKRSGIYVLRRPVSIGYRLPTEAEWEYAARHDMSGNVSEWVNDYYVSFVDTSAVTDPLGPEEGTRHVVRGANRKSAAATDLRLAWRDGADGAADTLGFRVARYAE